MRSLETPATAKPTAHPSARRWWIFASALLLLGLVAGGGYWWSIPSEKALRKECRDLRQKGKWHELAELSSYWSNRNPQSADAWLFRSEAAQGLGKRDEVAEYLAHVPASDPRAVPAWIERAGLLFEGLNRPLEAAETCQLIIQTDPDVMIARQRLIFFYALTLQREKLINEVRAALEVHRESPEAYIYLVGSQWLFFANQYEQNSKWLLSYPGNETFEVARAMQVIKSNAKDHPERALEFQHVPDANQLLEKFPDNLEVVAYHLEKRMVDGDIEGVTELLNRNLPRADYDARIWAARGWLHDQAGDFEAAVQDLNKSLEIDPYGWQVYHQLADLHRRLGNLDKVGRYSRLYEEGKKLREVISRLPDAQAAPPEVFQKIFKYAEDCGDVEVVNALKERI